MIASEARLAANRANARKSTGPVTEQGKERSRANSLRHGLTGAGVVLPPDLADEVERRALAFRSELAPRGEVQAALVRQAALLSVRMERCAVDEAAAISARVRSAGPDFDEARDAEVDRLMAGIAEEPAASVRKLRRMPEGVDRMVAVWASLRDDVAFEGENRWGAPHRRMAENLTGRGPGDFGVSRVEALARAIRGDFTLLAKSEGAGLGDGARMAWARARMAEFIDAEIGKLRAHRETLDLDALAADRAGAAARALFDPSKAATLARRYEAAAERGFYRALKDLKAAQKAEAARKVAPACQAPPLASFSAPALGSERSPASPGRMGSGLPSNSVPMAIGRPPGGRA